MEQINKLEAIERQMKEAVWLFFEKRDAVSICTLASAADQAITDIAKKRGVPGLSRDPWYIKEDRRREWMDAIKRQENFFKHADKDPDGVLDFSPVAAELTLFDAIYVYINVTSGVFWEAQVYVAWILVKYPDFLMECELKSKLHDDLLDKGVDHTDFELFRQLLEHGVAQ